LGVWHRRAYRLDAIAQWPLPAYCPGFVAGRRRCDRGERSLLRIRHEISRDRGTAAHIGRCCDHLRCTAAVRCVTSIVAAPACDNWKVVLLLVLVALADAGDCPQHRSW